MIKLLTGITLATAMAAASVQAATYTPEEPYANFAVDQQVHSDEGGMMTERVTMQSHDEKFWGWSVDEPLK